MFAGVGRFRRGRGKRLLIIIFGRLERFFEEKRGYGGLGKEVLMDQIFSSQVRHLYEVEELSMRQISKKLGVSRKGVSRVIRNEEMGRAPRESILKPYE